MAEDAASTEQVRERRWALSVAALAMALTMLPYLYGLALVGAGRAHGWFSWLGYNLDDSCVYLAWMRQAADGGFFQRNLFTTEPQLGHQFNLFFVLLGWLAALTRLPLIAVYHLARVALGVALLRSVWWLLELWLVDLRARRAAYLLVAFSAGLGWLPGLWHARGVGSPVDAWQPEAITFLCLYLSPLFLVGLLLMVGVLGWLWVGERTGEMRPAVYAGLCGLLLGNIHSYDVITLTGVWLAFLIARTAVARRFSARSLRLILVAGLPTAVSVGYMFWLFRTEQVFAQRVAVETLSYELRLYVLGYGLVLLLALVAAVWLTPWIFARREKGGLAPAFVSREAALLLVVWGIVNLALAYAPVSFQRKLLMGEHLPLAILAGVLLWRLLRPLGGAAWRYTLAGCVLVLSLTNLRFMYRDVDNFTTNRGQSGIQRPYMYPGEVAALGWLRDHAPKGAPIQPLPWFARDGRRFGFTDTTVACFAPGLTGHPVNAGHWGETPDFATAMLAWVRFQLAAEADDERRALLRQTGVRYLLVTQKHMSSDGGDAATDLRATFGAPRAYLRRIPEASNEDADVYEVVSP